MNRLVIVGACGHGRVIADVAKLSGNFSEIVFLDNHKVGESHGYSIMGKVEEYSKFIEDSSFFVAIGHNEARKKMQLEMMEAGAHMATLVHPMASIGSEVKIGAGTVVMAGAVINAGAKIGQGVIINTCSSVDHDGVIGDFVHIAVGAHLAGNVTVCDETLVGAGATLISAIMVRKTCQVGAGAVVLHNINEPGTYVGVPAKKHEK